MERIKSIFIGEGSHRLLMEYFPLINILFFIEIVYFMFIISFLWGKIVGAIFGIPATTFLIWQTLGLYNRRNLNRQLQLFMFDIHFALSMGFLVNRIFVSPVFSFLDYIIFIERGLAVLIEIPALLFLTGKFFNGVD